MPLTREFKETVVARVATDPDFAMALLGEAVQCMIDGDLQTGKAILRDYINATVGFDELATRVGKKKTSLMRMLSPHGNPNAENIFGVIHSLQDMSDVHLEVRPT